MKKPFLFLLFALLIGIPRLAFSDDNPCDYAKWSGSITEIRQEDQSVQLSFKIANYADYGCTYSEFGNFQFWRINDTENKQVFIDRDYNSFQNITPLGPCVAWDNWCLDDPIGCEDCDGDGVPDCPAGFCTGYTFDWVDECVPTGKTSYHLSSYGGLFSCEPGAGSYNFGYDCVDKGSINITDNGGSCGPWHSADSSVDPCQYTAGYVPIQCGDDTADDTVDKAAGKGENSNSHCGGCSVEKGNSGLPLSIGMLAAGLFLLIITRRK